jgi:hypothetical protein
MFRRADCGCDVTDPSAGGVCARVTRVTLLPPPTRSPRPTGEGDDDECVLGVASARCARLRRLTSKWRDALRLCRGGDH